MGDQLFSQGVDTAFIEEKLKIHTGYRRQMVEGLCVARGVSRKKKEEEILREVGHILEVTGKPFCFA
jgi:hypothetical protein